MFREIINPLKPNLVRNGYASHEDVSNFSKCIACALLRRQIDVFQTTVTSNLVSPKRRPMKYKAFKTRVTRTLGKAVL